MPHRFDPKIYLCSEVLRHLPFAQQCQAARQMGYDGLEVAPFTLADDPFTLTTAQLAAFRQTAIDEGIELSGLHWLMAQPEGLSITSLDPQIWGRTRDFGLKLIEICQGLGGRYLVHGSPAQRQLQQGAEAQGMAQARAYFAQMAQAATESGCLYLLEPLSPKATGCFTSLEATSAFVDQLGLAQFGTMLDCFATADAGADPAEVLAKWLPRGGISHVHLNDDNSGGPGQGRLDFHAILGELAKGGYQGAVAIEPFVYLPDPMDCARLSIAHVRACLAALRG